jgi:hypothetical protein
LKTSKAESTRVAIAPGKDENYEPRDQDPLTIPYLNSRGLDDEELQAR